MLVFSHRGYHTKNKENTIDAFSSSLNFRIDGIETDVRRTADNVAVLFHNRLTPPLSPVAGLTHAELDRAVGYHVPTLSEALSKWNHIVWDIEIKTPDAFRSTLDILKHYKSSQRIIVTSFFHDLLVHAAAALNIECGAIIAHNPLDLKQILLQLRSQDERIDKIVLPFEILSQETVSIAHDHGFETLVYGVGLPTDFMKCAALSVDAVITDRPDLIPFEI